MKPFDLKSGEFIISYVDKNGKKQDDIRFEATPGKSTMNSTLFISIAEVKEDGTMNIDYSYSSVNGEEISSQSN
ncbi:hypothetical protein [Listeria cornellensis]|uniref:Uncharacterized protein n=1 Tax=Listeria cornellensis FSL F6-0969 TaxID=1265820 RepID=W7C1N7_9LIST|nr:hypothetical protein [Listeria cornellensis]EUJ31187.1 hypothetical protein PCORN_06855 [Listeria cornellensis FSL F6-0969]